MFEAAITEFPFVGELPQREKSKLAKVWDELKELDALTEKHGNLVPYMMVGRLLNISAARVTELAKLGRLDRVELGGVVLIGTNSIVAYAQTERKAGRPCKVTQPTWKDCKTVWKDSVVAKVEK